MALPAVRSNGRVVRWDSFRDVADPNRQFDQLVRFAGGQSSEARAWRSVTDVDETESAWVVSLELPGLKREQITVDVDGDKLSVTGEYREAGEGEERPRTTRRGKFAYRARLPKGVDAEQIGAGLADGVLTLTLPKPAAVEPRRIEITEA